MSGDEHRRRLERLYASAAINGLYPSELALPAEGVSRIDATIEPRHFHAAGAAHGSVYFKLLDDAAFFAANSLVADVFVLTTNFTISLARPMPPGRVVAEGRWTSGRRRTLFAEARLLGPDGEEAGRGSGVFMRSRIALRSLPGYGA